MINKTKAADPPKPWLNGPKDFDTAMQKAEQLEARAKELLASGDKKWAGTLFMSAAEAYSSLADATSGLAQRKKLLKKAEKCAEGALGVEGTDLQLVMKAAIMMKKAADVYKLTPHPANIQMYLEEIISVLSEAVSKRTPSKLEEICRFLSNSSVELVVSTRTGSAEELKP